MGIYWSSKNQKKVQQKEFTFESSFEYSDPESDSQSTPKEIRRARENYNISWHGIMDARETAVRGIMEAKKLSLAGAQMAAPLQVMDMEAAFSHTRSAATYESDSAGKSQSHRKSLKWK
jgi:hypothetical protein